MVVDTGGLGQTPKMRVSQYDRFTHSFQSYTLPLLLCGGSRSPAGLSLFPVGALVCLPSQTTEPAVLNTSIVRENLLFGVVDL